MPVKRILLTGATGFIGSELLRRLVRAEAVDEVRVLVRPARIDGIGEWLDGLVRGKVDERAKIRVYSSELAHADLGMSPALYRELASGLTDILHLAADVRFHLPIESARDSNLLPVRNLVKLALESSREGDTPVFHQVSTYAVSRPGLDGVAHEEAAPKDRVFRNTYEQTKAEAEWYLLEQAGELPFRIYRTSIVAGDSRNGWTLRFNSFYQFIRIFVSEVFPQLPEIPVDPSWRLDMVTVDYIADSLLALLNCDPSVGKSILHLGAGAQSAPAIETFSRGVMILTEKMRASGLAVRQPPVFYPAPAGLGPDLARLLDAGFAQRRSLMGLFAKYLPYLQDSAVYDNSGCLGLLGPERGAPRTLHQHLDPILDYCVRTDWGDRPEGRPEL